jgi:3-dehydroquinate synthase
VQTRALQVELPGGEPVRYQVWVGEGLLARVGDGATRAGWVLVTDTNVGPLYADAVAAALAGSGAALTTIQVAAGEASKVRRTVERIHDQALQAGVSRDWGVVALGGGVVGDLAGFAAATLLRGLPYVQVPTSLLAMVDSSVGGKTGVDTPAGKNLVGAFHQPEAVYADVTTLSTLPDRELIAGLAEVIKYGVILDEQLFVDLDDGLLESCLQRVPDALAAIVNRCVALKAGVVAADEREAGPREILNFGHTVAHGIERATDFGLLHGEAVAVGMVAEARLAERFRGAEAGTSELIASLCRRAGLPVKLPQGVSAARVVEAARADKKVRAGSIRCALPEQIGRMPGHRQAGGIGAGAVAVTEAELAESLASA